MADTFTVKIQVGDRQGTVFEEVEVLVGSGALYTHLPTSLLKRLSVKPTTQRTIRRKDATTIIRDVGEACLRLPHESLINMVVFDDEGVFLLGDLALSSFGVEADPEKNALVQRPSPQMTAVH